MVRTLCIRLSGLVLVACATMPALADDKAEAKLAQARKSVEAVLVRTKTAADGNPAAAALPLLEELRRAAVPYKADPEIQGFLAHGVRWVYEALLGKSEDSATNGLRSELQSLAIAKGVSAYIREEYVELLLTDYATAMIDDSANRAEATLAGLRAVMAGKPDSKLIRAAVLRAHAYAHRRLAVREAHPAAAAMLKRVAELALASEATEDFRDRFSWALEVEHRTAFAHGDAARVKAALERLRNLAMRDAARPAQRASLARRLRVSFSNAWRADDLDGAWGHLKELTALGQRKDANDSTRNAYVLTLDYHHRLLDDARLVQDRVKAYRVMRSAVRRIGLDDATREGLIYTLAREQAALHRQGEPEAANTLLAELRPLCQREPPQAPNSTLAWALAANHSHLSHRRRFTEADAMLAELRALAAHPEAVSQHRDELAFALADAIRDVNRSKRARDPMADLAELRALVAHRDSGPYRRVSLLRALLAALQIAHAAGDHERAALYVEEAETSIRNLEVTTYHRGQLVQILAVAFAFNFRRGAVDAATRQELRMIGLADGDDATPGMRGEVSSAWIRAHLEAEADHDPARAERATKSLRAWLANPEATRTPEDHTALAILLYNRVYYTLRRGETEAADAALSELRTLAGAAAATQRMGSELAAALLVVHYRLAQNGEPAADRLLDELRLLVAGGSAGTPALVSLARALSWAHRKHGNALVFDVAKRELDEMRRFAQVAENADVDESLARSLRDAIWDHVYSARPLELATVVEELHVLVHGERAGPAHRGRLAQALRDVHNGIIEKKIKGNAQLHLDRLVSLSKRPDAEIQAQEATAHARRVAYEAALEAKKYGQASALLVQLRTSAEAAGASTYMKERYANALVDLIWDEGRRERWEQLGNPLERLRTLWRTPSDARYRGYLVWGLRCAHGHLRWDGRTGEASALLEELRGLALPAKVESWEWRELAYALRECVTYSLAEPATREDAEAPLSELSRIALTPSKDEGLRNHLSLALLRLCEWALRENEAEQHAATLSQLRMLALRKQATASQQQRLAEALDGDAAHALAEAVLADLGIGKGGAEQAAEEKKKALAESFRDRIHADIDIVRVLSEREQAAVRTRELYAQILETGCLAAFGSDKTELGQAHLRALRTLATTAGATPEIRIAHVHGLEVALNSVVETGGPEAATALLDALAAYVQADGATSEAAVHYGMALGTVASAYRKSGNEKQAEPLLRRLRELAKAQPENPLLRFALTAAESDD